MRAFANRSRSIAQKLQTEISAFGYESIYPNLPLLAIFLAFVPTPEPGACPAGPPPGSKIHRSLHFRSTFSDTSRINSPLSSGLVPPSRRTYPPGNGKPSIRRSMLPNRRRVRWLSLRFRCAYHRFSAHGFKVIDVPRRAIPSAPRNRWSASLGVQGSRPSPDPRWKSPASA
jgi:hypothetical protein